MSKKKIYIIAGLIVLFIGSGSIGFTLFNGNSAAEAEQLSAVNEEENSGEVLEEENEALNDTEPEEYNDVDENSDEEEAEEVSEENTEGEPVEEEEERTVTVSTKYVAVNLLNIRSGPGTDHKVIGTAPLNEEVLAEDSETENRWVKITSGSVSGYVFRSHLSSEKTKVEPVVTQASESSGNNSGSSSAASASNNSESNKTAENKAKSENKSKAENKSEADNKAKEESKPASNSTSDSAKPKNDADKLTTVANNNQLILVTTNGYGTSAAKIQTFERNANGTWDQVLSVSGFIGRSGFAQTKREGDGKSPRGKYTIGTAFGNKGNPGTKLPFRGITSDDVWVDDPESPLYNTWQSRKKTEGQWKSAENMQIPQYNYGFVINYNTSNIVPGAGSAIFFHVANNRTLGCTGVSESNMISILKWLDPAKNPVIIQAPESELSNY